MASSQRLASQKNREPRLAVRAVKGTLFSTGGGGGRREDMSHLRHCFVGNGGREGEKNTGPPSRFRHETEVWKQNLKPLKWLCTKNVNVLSASYASHIGAKL